MFSKRRVCIVSPISCKRMIVLASGYFMDVPDLDMQQTGKHVHGHAPVRIVVP